MQIVKNTTILFEPINIVNYIYYSELIINFVFPYRWANDKTNEKIKT